MRITHLFMDKVTTHGTFQYRLRAYNVGEVVHTVIRWSAEGARHEMRVWLSRGIPLVADYEQAN